MRANLRKVSAFKWLVGAGQPRLERGPSPGLGCRLGHPLPRCGRGLFARVGLAGRVGVVLRQGRVHVVPGLGALDEDVGLRTEGAGVVERADAEADDVRPGRYLDVKRRAAIAAECADDLVAAIGLADIAFWGALSDAEPGGRHPDRRDIGGAAAALAIAAVALQREQGLALAFVAHRTAQAPAGSCCGHHTLHSQPVAGLVPATHVFSRKISAAARRGWPGQGRARGPRVKER